MAGRTKKRDGNSRQDRLELIRARHRALIIEPRAMIAADFDHEFGDAFDDLEEVEMVEVGEMVAVD